MQLLVEVLSQAPLVALMAYLWWRSYTDAAKELDRLRRRVEEKDEQLREFIRVFDKMTITLELIKDRVGRG
jgi:hypothetical protein